MNPLYPTPQIDPTAFIAPGATVVGNVQLAAEVNVWYQAVLRGDIEPIVIEARTNIQDGSILHTSAGFPLHLAEGVTVGHGAVIHGASVGANTLVGIRSVLLDGVVVGEDCLVAAGALLAPGKTFPPGVLIMGFPARIVRALTPAEIEQNREAARRYVERAKAGRAALAGQ